MKRCIWILHYAFNTVFTNGYNKNENIYVYNNDDISGLYNFIDRRPVNLFVQQEK